MRVGMSWPTGRGHRQWISVGPAGAAVLSVFWVATWLIWAVLMAVYGAVWSIGWLFTRALRLATR